MTALEDYQKLSDEEDLLKLYEELGDAFGGPDDYDPIVSICTSLVDPIPLLPNTSKSLTQKLIALRPTEFYSPNQWANKRHELFELLEQIELEEAERLETSWSITRKLEAEDRLKSYHSQLVVLAGAFNRLTPLHDLVSKHHEAVLEAADYHEGLEAEKLAAFERLADARDRYFLTGVHEEFEAYLDAVKVFDAERMPGSAGYWKLVDELHDRIQVTLMLREVAL